MGFLIDTNLWISIKRGRLSAADIHAITQQAPVYLSPVKLHHPHLERERFPGRA